MTVHTTDKSTREYDLELLKRMQSMEDFMLVRYFIDAEKLTLSFIQVKNTSGHVQTIPGLSVVLK
jgi:hypothetical protein